MNIVMENASGSRTQYIRGVNLISQRSVYGEVYFAYNTHGDVVKEIGSNGVAAYDAFGNVRSGKLNSPFGYAGEYTDAESGLIYLRARYYDPAMGRFVSEDPHWNTGNMIYGDNGLPSVSVILQSSNLYIYVNNNPVFIIIDAQEGFKMKRTTLYLSEAEGWFLLHVLNEFHTRQHVSMLKIHKTHISPLTAVRCAF